MATAQSIINSALRRIGALAEDGSPSPARSAEALEMLNDMMDSWQIDSYLIYAEQIVTKAATLGKASYTIAASNADILTPRPADLIGAYVTIGGVDYPAMDVLSDDDYAGIPVKNTPGTPDSINFAATYPAATIFLYPVPNVAMTLNLRISTPLQSFAGLSTTYAMPAGHKRAITLNLALELAPSEEKEPSMTLAQQARDAKALVKRKALQNATPPLSVIEMAGAGRRWNFNTGD